MTDVRETVRELVAIKAIEQYLAAHAKELKDRLTLELDAGDRKKIRDHDGNELGMAYVTDPQRSITVADEAALLAWVGEHYPDEVVTARSVRPSFLAALRQAGGVDPDTGEVVPGFVEVVKAPVMVVRPSEYAKRMAGELVGPMLPEVTA